MQQYNVIAGLIQYALHLVKFPTFQLAKAPSTITEPHPCFTIGVIQGVAALSPTPLRTYILLFDESISNFDSSIQRTLFQYSVVESLCALSSTERLLRCITTLQYGKTRGTL